MPTYVLLKSIPEFFPIRSQMYTSSSASQATMTTSCVLDDVDMDRTSKKAEDDDSISAKSIVLCPIYCICSYYKSCKSQVSQYCSNHLIVFILCALFVLLIFNFALYSYIFYLAHQAGHQFWVDIVDVMWDMWDVWDVWDVSSKIWGQNFCQCKPID